MDTNDLINALAADTRRPSASLANMWWVAGGLAVALAAVVFFLTLGPRPDISAAAETPRFLFKFVVATALAATAFGVLRALSRPGDGWRAALPYLAVAPVLLAMAVVVELFLLPPDLWSARLIGANSMVCLVFIPLIGIAPLAVLILALRRGATTRPAIAGAVAGVLAGAIAAGFYAAHCTDDSPLFVATWYTLAVAGLTLGGAALASRLARW